MNSRITRVGRLAALLAFGAMALAQRTHAQAQPPKFHTETNFVRVDVYPTVGGAPLRDLTAADFEILEDGEPQKIETFERVDVPGPAVADAGREPSSVAESRQIAEATRGRLFVIFLDTYFVDVTGSNRIRQPLVNLLNRLVGPDDMFAVMTPDMSAADITFARRTETVEGYLSRYWFWGQRDRLYPDDPVEQNYMECFGASSEVAKEMIQRRREKKVIDALDDLTKYLRGVREERKAVITITGGWVLFQPSRMLLRPAGPTPDVPRAGTTPDGRLTADAQPYNIGMMTRQQCDHDRLMLAEVDDRGAFSDLMGNANRANVSFYPLNALGLVATDKPMGPRESDSQPLTGEVDAVSGGALPDQRLVQQRSENLIALAGNTDGVAVVNTNDLERGLHRIASDLTSYYLIGYYSSNGRLDGKYRKITVKVNRPGVDVRARRGYRAPTADEVERGNAATAARTALTPVASVQAALTELGAVRPGVPLRTGIGYASLGAGPGNTTRAHVWALGELDVSVARTGEWLGGGSADVTVTGADGITLSQTKAVIVAGQRTFTADLGELAAPNGKLIVRFRVTPLHDGMSFNDTLRVGDLPASGRPLVLRRGPTTGIKYVPTADLEFQRTERVRMDLPTSAPLADLEGVLLDRHGSPLPLKVTTTSRVDGGVTWVSADVNLAPLAAGDYVMRLKGTSGQKTTEVVTGIRVVP